MSWAAQYIGIPWVAGESDCWSFSRRVWRERFGFEVPVIDVDAHSRLASSREFAGHEEYGNWESVEMPADGDAVMMGKNKVVSHIGIWCGPAKGVVHSVEGVGVVFTKLPALAGMGLRVLRYYRRLPCAHSA